MHFRNYSLDISRQLCTQVVRSSIRQYEEKKISQQVKQKIKPHSIQFVENQSNQILKIQTLKAQKNSTIQELQEPLKKKKKLFNEKKQNKKSIRTSNISIGSSTSKNSQYLRKSFLMSKLNRFQNRLIPLERERKENQNWELQNHIENLRKKKNRIQQMMININQSIKPKDVKEKDNQKNLEIPQFTTGLNGILLNFDKKKPKGNGVQRDKGKIKPIFSIIDITKDKEDIFNLKESIPTQIVFREKEKQRQRRRKSFRDLEQESFQYNFTYEQQNDIAIQKLLKSNHKKTNSLVKRSVQQKSILSSKKNSMCTLKVAFK